MTDPTLMARPEPGIWFRTVCRKNGLDLSDSQLDLFARYAAYLLDWNKKVNLISRRDEENLWEGHFLHSVSIVLRAPFAPGENVLDLGTGGGLPGIPLKICRPDLSFVLVDATKKKVDAVSDIIQKLGLAGVEAAWGRAEELGRQPRYAHQFDTIVARAVAALDDLVKWGRPFLRMPPDGGRLITLKGGDLEKEVRRAHAISGVKNIQVLGLDLSDASEFLASDKKIVVVAF